MSADAKVGERNTLKGMNPPGDAPPASEPSPRLNTEEFDAPDWRGLSPEEIELLKQGKSLERGPVPLAGAQEKEEPVDPTPIELPKHATAYEAPHEAAALTDHKTIETKTIKVDAESDQRRSPTQRSLARPPKREVVANAPPRSSRWGVWAALFLVLVGVVVIARLVSSSEPTEIVAPTEPTPVVTIVPPRATSSPVVAAESATTAPAEATSSKPVEKKSPRIAPATPSTGPKAVPAETAEPGRPFL